MDWKKKIAAVIFLLALVCVPVAAVSAALDRRFLRRRDGNLRRNGIYSGCFLGMERILEQLETYFSEQFPGAGRIAHSESGDGDGHFWEKWIPMVILKLRMAFIIWRQN